MKKNLFYLLIMVISFSLLNQSCSKDDDNNNNNNETEKNFPTTFSVNLPSSISDNQTDKQINEDTLSGGSIYEHLRTFIYVGEASAHFVQEIMTAISIYQLNKPMDIYFVGNDDERIKNLVVVENSEFNDVVWEFQLTISDSLSKQNDDEGKALQVFWNTNPVKGIAIMKPYNLNRNTTSEESEVMFSVYYSEAGENDYEKQMLVSIAGLPLENPLVDPYSVSTLKMFAGKNGNDLDIYGNSNHPNAKFFNSDVGFNWAFVASCNYVPNIAVAEVGLPPSNLNETNRDSILDNHSIYSVFSAQIYEEWPEIEQSLVDAYLNNTVSPAFFDEDGFIQSEIAPSTSYNSLITNMELLTPFNPSEVSDLTIEFK